MLAQAEKLIQQGFKIFPIVYKNKIPLTPNGFKDASNSFAQLEKWDNQFKTYNIAIKTGEGICVIDIDVKNGGSETWLELLEHNELPDTVCANTGGGGKHFFFKGDIKNTAGKLGKGIDTRGEGGYVVSPPSIHPSGKLYEWAFEHSPDDLEMADLPDWLNPELSKPVFKDNVLNFTTADHLPKDHYASAEYGTLNTSLTSLAGELIQEGDDYNKVMRTCLLWNRGNDHHLPLKEIETTVKSVFKTHRKNHPSVIKEAPVKLILEDEDKPNLSLDQIKVGGIIQDMCEWIDSLAYKPQPILTFANVIAFFSSVIGRNYRLSDDTRSNIYTLGIAPTGSGKDNSRKAIAKLASDASLEFLFGAEDVTSGSAILTALDKTSRKTVFFPFDEIGSFLTNKTGKNASSHQSEIPALLTKLFTTSNSVHFGKQFADEKSRPRCIIDQPHISIYGTGNPDQLFSAITEDMITGGFFGRMLCFFPLVEYPKPNRHRKFTDPPSQLVADLYQWFLHETPVDPLKTQMQNAMQHTAETIQITEEAEDIFYDFYEVCETYRANYRYNKGLDALWVRSPEMAKKYSLMFSNSLGRVPGKAQPISPEMAQDCCDMIKIQTERTCMECSQNVLGSDFEGVQNKIMERIRQTGAKGLTKRDMSISMRKIQPQIRKQAIETLMESGLIFQEDRELDGSNKKTSHWFLRKS